MEINDNSPASGNPIPGGSELEGMIDDYQSRLHQIVKNRLNKKLQAKISPEDIVQSAFRSFFRRSKDFTAKGKDDLWGLLVIITLRKCAKWEAKFSSQKRSLNRERQIQSGSMANLRFEDIISRSPGPDDEAELRDILASLFSKYGERECRVIQLRLEGLEIAEIAERLKSSNRTVSRVIASAKKSLAKMLESLDTGESDSRRNPLEDFS